MAVLRAIAEYPEKFCVRLLPKALLGIFALLCGNTYIVGINQIFDERIDIVSTVRSSPFYFVDDLFTVTTVLSDKQAISSNCCKATQQKGRMGHTCCMFCRR